MGVFTRACQTDFEAVWRVHTKNGFAQTDLDPTVEAALMDTKMEWQFLARCNSVIFAYTTKTGPLSLLSTGEYAITCYLNRFQTDSVNASGSSKPVKVNQFSQTSLKKDSVWTPCEHPVWLNFANQGYIFSERQSFDSYKSIKHFYSPLHKFPSVFRAMTV